SPPQSVVHPSLRLMGPMTRLMSRTLAPSLLATLLSLSMGVARLTTETSAHAQAQSDGFALNHFDPSERGSDWFANESLDLRGNGRLAVGLVGYYAYKRLAVYAADGSERTVIVRHQLFGHLGAGVILIDRLRLDAS